jgi:hypothetical protein
MNLSNSLLKYFIKKTLILLMIIGFPEGGNYYTSQTQTQT